MKSLLFTICGRAGSKGVKSKNCREFLGTPIVYYTLSAIELYSKEHGMEFNAIDIVLSTDSQVLIQQVKSCSNKVIIVNRSGDLSGDLVSKIDVVRDAVIHAEAHSNIVYDIVVDLDITSPIRTVQDIYNSICKSIQSKADIVFSVTGSRRNPYFNMVKKDGDYYTSVLKSEFTTRQECPQFYDMNASIYAYNRDFLLTSNKILLLDAHCDIIEMIDTGILDIDSEEDLELMEVIAQYLFTNRSGLREIWKVTKCVETGEPNE